MKLPGIVGDFEDKMKRLYSKDISHLGGPSLPAHPRFRSTQTVRSTRHRLLVLTFLQVQKYTMLFFEANGANATESPTI
jgi:hypothetical protein